MRPQTTRADFRKDARRGEPVRTRRCERAHPTVSVLLLDSGQPADLAGKSVSFELWDGSGHTSVPCEVDDCTARFVLPAVAGEVRAAYIAVEDEGSRITTQDIALEVVG